MHPPPRELNVCIQKSIMADLTYPELKQILLDWTVKIANAIIDGTRSAEDAKDLRDDLAKFIEELSSSDLRISKVKEEVNKFTMLTRKDSGSDDCLHPNDIGNALSQGASMKEFNEWQSGGLGGALEEQVESILGEDWLHS